MAWRTRYFLLAGIAFVTAVGLTWNSMLRAVPPAGRNVLEIDVAKTWPIARHRACSPRPETRQYPLGSLEGSAVSVRATSCRKRVGGQEVDLSAGITIRPFSKVDAAEVRDLFITVNRLLSPPNLHNAFEAYIALALTEEIDRITAYYAERKGGFWVAVRGDHVVGTFGLELASEGAMELRRMYVEPSARRKGIARQMLQFAEDECRRRNIFQLELSTAEIQGPALALYRNAGYKLVREETADMLSNKTVGAGIRRYYFEKALR